MMRARKTPRGGGERKDRDREGVPPQEPSAARADRAGGEWDFPIVAIGCSAGGLEALQVFFLHTSRDPGMAFVVISHLDPSHASVLPEIIRRYTKLHVLEIEDGEKVAVNRVYILPPNRDLTIEDGRLSLVASRRAGGVGRPIDRFFESLAHDQGRRAVCVVLSGMGSDGTAGLESIKAKLGAAFVQHPDSAKFDGMPRSAIDSGLADLVLPVEEIPQALERLSRGIEARGGREEPEALRWDSEALQEVVALLHGETGHDFTHYKLSAVSRRLQRRMNLRGIGEPTGYLDLLRRDPEEVRSLSDDLLIGVTGFFRDPEAFSALEKAVVPSLRSAQPGNRFRAWVPACSTGEEAYSLAMVLMDSLRQSRKSLQLQIFATDLDAGAVEKARAGTYPAKQVTAEVGAERIGRYFIALEDAYRIRKEVRDRITFSVHDAAKDPPFIRLDLVSCRNLMIYLEPELQKRLLLLFHYGLNPDGLLFLGSAESIQGYLDLFEVRDRHAKIFRRKGTAGIHRPFGDLDAPVPRARPVPIIGNRAPGRSIRALAERELLARFAPPSLIVDEGGEILFVHGRTGRFLELSAGETSLNVLDMAREGLKAELTAALREAADQGAEVVKEQLIVRGEATHTPVAIAVRPLDEPGSERRLFVITLTTTGTDPAKKAALNPPHPAQEGVSREAALERELISTRENLQRTIEELESANEELRSAGEETQSVNEELQSTNEELETTREEQQSLNQELISVNAELQDRLVELGHVNDDMKNLLDSLEVPALFVDNQLHIKRFTRHAPRVVNLIPGDIGRPLEHVVSNLDNVDLVGEARDTLLDLVGRELEVRTRDGRWYLLRTLPYRTVEDDLDGVVLTFVDIHNLKAIRDQVDALNQQLREEQRYQAAVIDTLRESVLVLDGECKVVSANRRFYETFKETPASTEGRQLYELGDGQWDLPRLRGLLEQVISEGRVFEGFRVGHTFPRIGRKVMVLNARKIPATGTRPALLLLAIEDESPDEVPRGSA
jgi:two-component system CheB/CheR fusion protein